MALVISNAALRLSDDNLIALVLARPEVYIPSSTSDWPPPIKTVRDVLRNLKITEHPSYLEPKQYWYRRACSISAALEEISPPWNDPIDGRHVNDEEVETVPGQFDDQQIPGLDVELPSVFYCPARCNGCKREFQTQQGADAHYAAKHTGLRGLSCIFGCLLHFVDQHQLDRHYQSSAKHPDFECYIAKLKHDGAFKCPCNTDELEKLNQLHCQYYFHGLYGMLKHITAPKHQEWLWTFAQHLTDGDHSLVCAECKFVFPNKYWWLMHFRTHSRLRTLQRAPRG